MPVSICTSISMSISMSTHTIVSISISTVTDNSYNNIKSRSRRSNQRIFPALPLLFLLVQPNPIDLLISRVSADLYWLRQVYRIDRLIEYISFYATIMCLLVLSRPFSSCLVLSIAQQRCWENSFYCWESEVQYMRLLQLRKQEEGRRLESRCRLTTTRLSDLQTR